MTARISMAVFTVVCLCAGCSPADDADDDDTTLAGDDDSTDVGDDDTTDGDDDTTHAEDDDDNDVGDDDTTDVGDDDTTAELDIDGDGYTEDEGDCDDEDPGVYPGAPEACDGVDNDCDGGPGLDEIDGDGDGFMVCDGDCDDGDAGVNPGAAEACNGIDDDCDPATGEHVDLDQDGYTPCDGDCDDGDPTASPVGIEVFCSGVDEDCLDGDAGIQVHPGDSIQAAIDGALTGDWICINPGTYDEEIVIGTTVSLVGVHGAAVTTVRGTGTGRVLTIEGAPDTRVEGLTIRDGVAGVGIGHGGGISVSDGSHGFEISNCVVTENTSWPVDGGGIYITGSDQITLAGNEVHLNTAVGGGGIYLFDVSGAQVIHNQVTGNSSGRAGGLWVSVASNVEVTDNEFSDHYVTEEAGALAVEWITELDFSRNVVSGNEADTGAAGTFQSIWGSLHVDECTFVDNLNSSGGVGILHAEDVQELTISASTFSDNTTQGPGGALFLHDVDDITLTEVTFLDNHAGSDGGALAVWGGEQLAITGSTFEGNESGGVGGGAYVKDTAQVHIDTSTFLDNSAIDGGGVHLFGTGDAVLELSEFVDNQAGACGGGIAFAHCPGAVDLHGNTISSNSCGFFGAGVYWLGTVGTSTDNQISDNGSGGDGGGAALGYGADVAFEGDTFESNDTWAIHCEDSLFSCSGVTFANNVPDDTPSCDNCDPCPGC